MKQAMCKQKLQLCTVTEYCPYHILYFQHYWIVSPHSNDTCTEMTCHFHAVCLNKHYLRNSDATLTASVLVLLQDYSFNDFSLLKKKEKQLKLLLIDRS